LSARLSAKPRADRPASACAFRLTASVRAQAGTQTGVGLPLSEAEGRQRQRQNFSTHPPQADSLEE
ncbi:MAG: hypothetical protein V1933_02155, partial [Candidatus Omnitrophota bacterium]